MFLSIERVLLLRQQVITRGCAWDVCVPILSRDCPQAEEERRSLYDWVLLTRLDVVWMRRLPLHALNSSLFYVANW